MSSNSKDKACDCQTEEDCSCEEDCQCDEESHQNQISMDSLDEDTKRKIQELQMIEQSLQQFIMQKQAFSMEQDETNLCLEELKKATGEIFKIVGGKIVIKTEKSEIEKELLHKNELISLRLKNMEKQEEELIKNTENLRQEIIKKISGN